MDLFYFIPGYSSSIYLAGREPAFIMLLSFIITYIAARGYTRIARHTGWGSASFGGVHTHHMVFGLVISFITAALVFSLTPEQGPFLLLLAALFGCGAALVLDEFALILHLEDVYWEKEGRKSIDAVVIAIFTGSLLMLRIAPFEIDEDAISNGFSLIVLLNLIIVIIAGLKGKIFLALIGIFIPIVSLIAAIRIAEPDSVWAKFLYKKEGKKIKKSILRYEHYEKVWRVRKEKIWDIIGGETGRPSRQNDK